MVELLYGDAKFRGGREVDVDIIVHSILDRWLNKRLPALLLPDLCVEGGKTVPVTAEGRITNSSRHTSEQTTLRTLEGRLGQLDDGRRA